MFQTVDTYASANSYADDFDRAINEAIQVTK